MRACSLVDCSVSYCMLVGMHGKCVVVEDRNVSFGVWCACSCAGTVCVDCICVCICVHYCEAHITIAFNISRDLDVFVVQQYAFAFAFLCVDTVGHVFDWVHNSDKHVCFARSHIWVG